MAACARRRRPHRRPPVQERCPARHAYASRGAAGVRDKRHHAGHHAQRTLAGAAGPRGLGAGAAGAFHRRARRHRNANAVFRSRLARTAPRQPQPEGRIRGAGVAAAARGDPCAVRWPRRSRAHDLLVRLSCANCIRQRIPPHSFRCHRKRACRRAAELVLADPTGAHEIDALARTVGTSARTLSRLFAAETQLSFKSWCQRARIAARSRNCR